MSLRSVQWIPRYLSTVDFLPGHKVSSDEWNALFNLSRAQGNNNAEGIQLLMETVGDSIEFPSILDSYSKRIEAMEETVEGLNERAARFTDEYISEVVSKTYVTKFEFENESSKITTLTEKVNKVEQKVTDEAITSVVSSNFYKKTEVDDLVSEQSQSLTTRFTQEADAIKASVESIDDRLSKTELELTEDSIIAKVSSAYATIETVEGIDEKVTTLTNQVSNVELQLTADSILAKVSDTLATKEDVNALDDSLNSLTERVTETESSIEVNTESISSLVSKITEFDDIYSTKDELVELASSISQDSEEITMSILAGYTTTDDLETYKKQIENTFSANEEGFEYEFKKLEEKLTELGNTVTTQNSYIRLENGEIVIGQSGENASPITTVYTNTGMEIRYNGVTVAKYAGGAMEVTNSYIGNQQAYWQQWAIRKGKYVTGKGYNLNFVWIGG